MKVQVVHALVQYEIELEDDDTDMYVNIELQNDMAQALVEFYGTNTKVRQFTLEKQSTTVTK